MIEDRAATNGQPYYCKTCGAGFGEYMHCEMPDCELESEAEAQSRAPQSVTIPCHENGDGRDFENKEI